MAPDLIPATWQSLATAPLGRVIIVRQGTDKFTWWIFNDQGELNAELEQADAHELQWAELHTAHPFTPEGFDLFVREFARQLAKANDKVIELEARIASLERGAGLQPGTSMHLGWEEQP